MAYVDVLAWQPKHVACWLAGVHESLWQIKKDAIIQNKINGAKLLMIAAEDITKLLSVNVETTEAILNGISLLRYLHFESNVETLQSLILKLACRTRCLYNHLVQAEFSPRLFPLSSTSTTPMTSSLVQGADQKTCFDFTKVDSNMQLNNTKLGQQRVSLETLDSVSDIAEIVKYVVSWLNNYPFVESKISREIRSIILRIAIELTSTAQRDQFVEYPNDILKKTCKFLADYCDYIVLALVDADYILACRLDIVSVKKKIDEQDYGLVIQKPLFWFDSIQEVVFSSAAHKSGRISRGDELIQIDYQTVVGWPIESIDRLLKRYQSEVILAIRKKPHHESQNSGIVTIVTKAFAIPLKELPSTNISDASKDTSGAGPKDEPLIELKEADLLTSYGEDNVAQVKVAPYVKDTSNVSSRESDSLLEAPKEPKGPVYEMKEGGRLRRELHRRASISGSISDALVDLALGDALPIPKGDGKNPMMQPSPELVSLKDKPPKTIKISRESLTKSVSHDTAKLYLHTLSIDKKHLW